MTLPESGSSSNVPQNPNGKLILYLIGYEPDAGYLDRLIGQVKGIVHAVAFVNTDGTDTCREVLERHGVTLAYDCMTFAERTDFDFSACRNRALELAESLVSDDHTWLMWLDCDDSIDRPEAILNTLRGQVADGYAFPYNVSAATDNIRKIRIHRPGQWRWINKVHEEVRYTCEKEPLIIYDPAVAIDHKPDDGKSNHDFHISLLTEGCRNAPNEYAYIGKEFFNRQEYDQALPWLLKTAVIHDWANEVYQAWLYAGYIALNHLKDNEKAEKWLLKAAKTMPQRREAWYFLSQMCARQGNDKLREALAYISCANAQIDEHQAMQHKGIYEREGYLLHAELLLAFGLKKQARTVLDKIKIHDEAYQDLADKC